MRRGVERAGRGESASDSGRRSSKVFLRMVHVVEGYLVAGGRRVQECKAVMPPAKADEISRRCWPKDA